MVTAGFYSSPVIPPFPMTKLSPETPSTSISALVAAAAATRRVMRSEGQAS